MAESSSPSISWVGIVVRGESVDPILRRCQQRQRLFSSGSILDWKKKKKKKEKKNYLFSIVFERFSDARCMPSLTDEQIWGNLNREIRGILLIIGIILEESSFIYIYHNSLFTY